MLAHRSRIDPGRVITPGRAISVLDGDARMTDILYLAGGLAVFGLFAAYAAALARL